MTRRSSVGGLGDDDARSLLEHAHGDALDAGSRERRLARLVGGNPGALIAIPPALTLRRARRDATALPEPLPAPPPLLRGYRPLLLALPGAARALLLAASLSEEADSGGDRPRRGRARGHARRTPTRSPPQAWPSARALRSAVRRRSCARPSAR